MSWFPFKFKKVSRRSLGIDIGTSSIKIVELSKRKEGFRLENYGEIKITPLKANHFGEAGRNTLFFSNKEIAKGLIRILKEAGIEEKEANFSIPDFATFFTNFELPSMSKEELVNAIKYEAKNYIPLSLSEVTLDWVITGGKLKTNAKEPLKILTVAIPNDTIIQYQEIASLSGLKITTLEAEAFALTRALKEDTKKSLAIIDIGARSTTCNIVEKGILKISYSFNVSGNELTDIISKSLRIPYEEAELIKREWGLLGAGKMAEVRESLIPLIDVILNEIKKAIQAFYQQEGEEVERIVLAGSSALLPGLKEYFSKETKKEVVVANPFEKVSYPSVLKDILKERGPSYAIAVGMAIDGFSKK